MGGAAKSTCVAKERVEEKEVGCRAGASCRRPCTSCTSSSAAGGQARAVGELHSGSVRFPAGGSLVAQALGMGRAQGPPKRPPSARNTPEPPAPSASIKARKGSAAGRARAGAVSTVCAP